MSLMYFQRISAALKQAKESWRNSSASQAGDWLEEGVGMTEDVRGAAMMRLAGGAMLPGPEILDPEQYLTETFAFNESSKCVPWLLKEVEAKRAEIQHAYLFEAKINGAGRMQKQVEGRKVPYKISRVFGTEAFQQALTRGDNAQAAMREAFRTKGGKLKEDWSGDGWGGSQNGPYDPNQYTEFAPITGGYFYAQQYLYDMLKGMAYSFECIVGDTRIPLLDGTSPTIKELSDKGENVWLYACDKDNNVVPALGINPHKTKTAQTVTVELDNGEQLRCTHDHPIMLRSGEFRNAGELKPGDSLMPLYRKPSRSCSEYESVYHPGMDLWESTHHLVARKMHTKRFHDVAEVVGTKHRHIDHINEDKRNNAPNNLQILTSSEHGHKTHFGRPKSEEFKANIAKRNSEWKRSPATLARMSDSIRKAWNEGRLNPDVIRKSNDRRIGEKRSEEFKEEQSERTRKTYEAIPGLREQRRLQKIAYWEKRKLEEPINHKVVSVRDSGVEDVYDIAVPVHHNFAIGQGIFVHNSWNHNPLAKRIIDGMAQYTLGRRFDWHLNPKAKDFNKKQQAWEKFASDINLRQRLSKYWIREKLIFGELFLNQKNWQSLHPATIWEIVTEPTDITNVYYYWRSFPTQYQMYSGYKVAGAPGADKVPSMRYVIEQIPYTQLIHLKGNCTSFEKRGRPKLFPVLGWLKRVKDLYQAQITRAQMQSDYAWDVAVDGSAQDVASFQSSNSCIPRGTGNTFVHNKAVTRTPMPMATGGSGRGGDQTVDNVLAFIATSCGFPKDFFNVISQGGGSRATALVGAEPFTKVIEDEQADWEYLLREKMFPEVMRLAGLEAEEDDIEFVFPSVTKDTTSEAISNIQIGKAEGLISNETAGQMYAQEMSITTYDYEDQQQAIKNEQSRGDILSVGGGLPSPGQDPDASGSTGDGSIGDSPIHGGGKQDLEDSLNSI